MTLLVSNTGDVESLKRMLNYSATGDVKLKLFKNNVTVAKTDTTSTYTESTAAGYSSATLTGSSWTFSTVNSVTTGTYPAVTFTYTAAETVYGYYVTNLAGTVLLWSEAFSAPCAIPSGGGSITVTPTITAN